MIPARVWKRRSWIWRRFAPAIVLGMLVGGCALIRVPAAEAPAAPIERSEYLPADDAKLYVSIRGADRQAPVLLWLHGGPGGAERPLFRYFNSPLENHFVVVYWDQRGAGRSFDPNADPKQLTLARHLADLDGVVDHLLESLGQEKIILVGHSWGAALGLLYTQTHPAKVSAVIGVNPLVSTRKAQQAQYEFVLAAARRRRDEGVLARLRELGAPPHPTATQALAVEKLADRYGGVFHRKPSHFWITIRAVLKGLVTPWEIPRFIRANDLSLEAMHRELLELDLACSVPQVEVPVLFLLGRHDRHVDARLAAAYFEALRAPIKRLIWFEQSAHHVPFEEPDRFHATLVRELESVGLGGLPGRHARDRAPEETESPDGAGISRSNAASPMLAPPASKRLCSTDRFRS
jgi:pimeloyl-ACP methyl ester carboxylesterase